MVKLLLDHSKARNIDLNSRDNNGRTGFHNACINGNLDVVKLLLDHSKTKNIDLNSKANNGNTAFHDACMEDNVDVVKLLWRKFRNILQ